MTPFLAKLVWWAAVIGWCAIRYPHERRARRTPVAQRTGRWRERLLLAVSLTGLFVVPATFVGTGEPRFADYPFIPALAWLGTADLALALMLFYRTHRDLGRFWSAARARPSRRPSRALPMPTSTMRRCPSRLLASGLLPRARQVSEPRPLVRLC
jgi:protein-S-isoprenylcysteine O-methyltransferase Ste14